MAPGRVMVIFSLGGAVLQRRLRGGAVRCRTGVVSLGGPPSVTLDPFPGREGVGVVEGGWAHLADKSGTETARRSTAAAGAARPRTAGGPAGLRWDDLDLLAFAGSTLWSWLVLPLLVDDPALVVHEREAGPGGRRVAVEVPAGWPGSGLRHVLHLDSEGRVVIHEEGDLTHELSGHCDFGGVELATRRRSRSRRRAAVGWGDIVAAHVLPPA